MQSLTHFLRSSNPNEQTLTVPSVIVNYLPLSVFPERRLRKQKKKKHFLCCGRFQFLLVAFRNTTTYREGDTKPDQIDDKARLFWGSIVKTKHQSLTSLACTRLVPGANQAVPHICIWCLGWKKAHQKTDFSINDWKSSKTLPRLKRISRSTLIWGEVNFFQSEKTSIQVSTVPKLTVSL